MSKIICDVCGTSYPETATQCPICGCIRPGEPKAVAGDTETVEQKTASTYTYVKGGRFSKKNVRKRNRDSYSYGAQKDIPVNEKKEPQKKSDKGLVIAVVALLLAIIAVVIYIVLRVFGPVILPGNNDDKTPINNDQGGNTSSIETSETVDVDVPCADIVITPDQIELTKEGASWLLNVEVLPEDTTDTLVIYKSDNEAIATVTGAGKVTAVAAGETYITVMCGDVTKKCLVKCTFESEEPEPSVYPMDDFEFDAFYNDTADKYDVTLNTEGQMHVLYAGQIPVSEITWTSDNESIVTFVDGVITAEGYGTTEVHAEYNGVKLSCIVRSYAVSSGSVESGNGGVSEETDGYTGPYRLEKTDVTIDKDDWFTLRLIDANGTIMSVNWQVENSAVCSVSGNKVTGLSVGQTKVSVNYEGQTYSCTVNVK